MNIIAALKATGILIASVGLILLPMWVPYRMLMGVLGLMGIVVVCAAWYLAYATLS